MIRPDDQLRRMLEQTLVPPTNVVELDPDTIDETTSRLGSVDGTIADSYTLNSQLSPADLTRLPSPHERDLIEKFYFETSLKGFQKLSREESSWVLQASSLPPVFQRFFSPCWTDPVVVNSLYSADLLTLIDGTLWHVVPGAPGFVREKAWGEEQAEQLRRAFPHDDLDSYDGLCFVVGHTTRASYLYGRRSVRTVGTAVGMIAGALFRAGFAPQEGVSVLVLDRFVDGAINRAIGCDGVERALYCVVGIRVDESLRQPVDLTHVLDQAEDAEEPAAEPGEGCGPECGCDCRPQSAGGTTEPEEQPACCGSATATPALDVAGPQADLAREVAAVVAGLDDAGAKALKEMAESARDVVDSRREATLGRVAHRVFERSVNEFFGGGPKSTNLPAELEHFLHPDPAALALPDVDLATELTLDQVLAARRSQRSFERGALSADDLAAVLKLAAGRNDVEEGYGTRNMPKFPYPSIGGLDSNELGVIVQNVEGFERGYYVYDKVGHGLVPRVRGDMRMSLMNVTFQSDWLFYAPAILVLANDQQKVAWKYMTRSYRISHLDQGALMQNLSLAAVARGLGSCAVAGFFDEHTNRMLGYAGTDTFVSVLMAVGRPNRLGHSG